MTRAGSSRAAGNLAGLLLFAGFCAVAVWIWQATPQVVPAAPGAPTAGLTIGVDDHAQRIAALIPITAERPLFHASRRPPQAPEPAAPPPPPEETIALVGILGDEAGRIALVRISSSTELFRVEAGGQLGPWEILAIGDKFVQVSKDEGAPFVLSIDE